jgi:DNA-binding NtrC family response regulator
MANILVIDDDIQFLGYLQEILRDEGHQVKTATNGKKVLPLISENQIDLLITDIFMPEKDGIELLRDLHKSTIKLKIICISGGGGSTTPGEVLKVATMLGATKTLNKPFTKRDLLPVIAEVMGQ